VTCQLIKLDWVQTPHRRRESVMCWVFDREIKSNKRTLGPVKPELNSKRRNGPCNALILLIWGSDFSKTWCHVCMLFRLVHG
jgi:hypothetical protein